MPIDSEEELRFGECPVGVFRELTFTLQNHTNNIFRFEWKGHPDFAFSPFLGHLQAKASKEVKVTFKSTEPRQHKNVALHCKLSKIRYVTPVADWDDTMVSDQGIPEGNMYILVATIV